jgi:hypothetical protein
VGEKIDAGIPHRHSPSSPLPSRGGRRIPGSCSRRVPRRCSPVTSRLSASTPRPRSRPRSGMRSAPITASVAVRGRWPPHMASIRRRQHAGCAGREPWWRVPALREQEITTGTGDHSEHSIAAGRPGADRDGHRRHRRLDGPPPRLNGDPQGPDPGNAGEGRPPRGPVSFDRAAIGHGPGSTGRNAVRAPGGGRLL